MPPSDSFSQMVAETRFSGLARKACKPCEGDVEPMDLASANELLAGMPGWSLDGNAIAKTFSFANHFETIAFVNAVAWISHSTDHHPDLEVGYSKCKVRYWTHSINGLSENDFICAAKVDAIVAL